jgi:hypothetical protein
MSKVNRFLAVVVGLLLTLCLAVPLTAGASALKFASEYCFVAAYYVLRFSFWLRAKPFPLVRPVRRRT